MTIRPVFTLYSDFNCPFCYALHERLYALRLLSRCEWRGVQHAPHLPRPMKPWEGSKGSMAAELRHELALVRRLAPDLPIALPAGKPHTGAAIERAIALLAQDRTKGMEFVREAYRVFWCEGQDLSDPKVLDQVARECVDVTRNSELGELFTAWATAWQATGQAGVPLIVSPDGEMLVGCVPTEEIIRFFKPFDS
ncbi:MAG TPA: DsbA family protein [Nitrospira sp.]|nr:DsbA family protein [Nitrospira sp.]